MGYFPMVYDHHLFQNQKDIEVQLALPVVFTCLRTKTRAPSTPPPVVLQNHVCVGREFAPVSVHPRVKLFLGKPLRGLVRKVLAVQHVALQQGYRRHRHGHQKLAGHDPCRNGAQQGGARHGNRHFVRKPPHLN